jgi:hypothetical protein
MGFNSGFKGLIVLWLVVIKNSINITPLSPLFPPPRPLDLHGLLWVDLYLLSAYKTFLTDSFVRVVAVQVLLYKVLNEFESFLSTVILIV